MTDTVTVPISAAVTHLITKGEGFFAKVEGYVKTEAHRVVAWAVTEGTTLLIFAHTNSTSFTKELAVFAAAAVASFINKIRVGGVTL